MNRRISTLILAICGCCTAAPERAVLTGTTLDCVAGTARRTAGVEVSIFPKSPQLTSLIEGVQKATDENIFYRFDKLIKFVKGTRALARVKSDSNGAFKVEIPALGQVIVFGYMETEDNPFYWMHSDVDIAHRSSVTVVLDYCKQR